MICNKCRQDLALESFAWRSIAKQIKLPTCKVCHNTFYGRVWYQKNKEKHKKTVYENREIYRHTARKFILAYLKAHPCSECGFSNPAALEFHHNRNKFMELSRMVTCGWSLGAIKKEILKCDVLCANCHRIQTAKEQGWNVSSGVLKVPSLGIEPRSID